MEILMVATVQTIHMLVDSPLTPWLAVGVGFLFMVGLFLLILGGDTRK